MNQGTKAVLLLAVACLAAPALRAQTAVLSERSESKDGLAAELGGVLQSVSDLDSILNSIEYGATEAEKLDALGALKAKAASLGETDQRMTAWRLSGVLASPSQPAAVRMHSARVLGEVGRDFSSAAAKEDAVRGLLAAVQRNSYLPGDEALEAQAWWGLSRLTGELGSLSSAVEDELRDGFRYALGASRPDNSTKTLAMMAFYNYLSAHRSYSGGRPGPVLDEVAGELAETARRAEAGGVRSDDLRGYLYLSMVRLCTRGEVQYSRRLQMVNTLEEASRRDSNGAIRQSLGVYVPILKRVVY